MAQPQICFTEFAKEEKDLFQIRESLREFAANGEISPPSGGNFCVAKNETTASEVVRHLRCLASQRPTALDPWELFAKQTFRTTAMAVVCGDLPPAAILRKGNALCALAKTLVKLTKALALVYSLKSAPNVQHWKRLRLQTSGTPTQEWQRL